jgi:hypothetical protein
VKEGTKEGNESAGKIGDIPYRLAMFIYHPKAEVAHD